MGQALAFEQVPADFTSTVDLANSPVTVTSPPTGYDYIDVSGILRDPEHFHGSTDVHDVVQLGGALKHLIGEFDDPDGFFDDPDSLPDQGVIILADHYRDAAEVVSEIDEMADEVMTDASLYDDESFCRDYYELAKIGYALLGKYVPKFEMGGEEGIPVSLVRAGLVTTRLALGLERDTEIEDEIQVITKRAHPKEGDPTDLMVTVKWEDPTDVAKLNGQKIEMDDFVNPASWASAAALLLSAKVRGATPEMLIHRSIMATEQGIVFARQALGSTAMGEIQSVFYTLGTSRTLTPQYYLENPAVGDAGHLLRHFMPSWYKQ